MLGNSCSKDGFWVNDYGGRRVLKGVAESLSYDSRDLGYDGLREGTLGPVVETRPPRHCLIGNVLGLRNEQSASSWYSRRPTYSAKGSSQVRLARKQPKLNPTGST